MDEYLNTDDLKEALHFVAGLYSPSVLYVLFGSEVDRSVAAELFKSGLLPVKQFIKGLQEISEVLGFIATFKIILLLFLSTSRNTIACIQNVAK